MNYKFKAGDHLTNGYGNDVEILKICDKPVDGDYKIVGLITDRNTGTCDVVTFDHLGRFVIGKVSKADLVFPKEKFAWTVGIAGYSIKLSKQGSDSYTVQYGAQVDSELTYANAAKELGRSILHALSCEGKI